MLIYKKGDVLNAPQSLIVHQCNAQDTMGSGVAKAIRAKYPQAYEEYVDYFKGIPKKDRMGMVQYTSIHSTEPGGNKIICNLIGQYDYLPRGIRHTNYDALEMGFLDIKLTYPGDIAMPKIGCGLGGGDWKIVSAIIESVFDDRDVYIYEL